jgi:hypothetical protein
MDLGDRLKNLYALVLHQKNAIALPIRDNGYRRSLPMHKIIELCLNNKEG